MATPFARSVRSLNASGFGPALVGLISAMLLLILWLSWFFLADITLYEIGETTQINPNGMIIARFPAESKGRVQYEQSAIIRFDIPNNRQPIMLPALVLDLTPHEEWLQVELLGYWNTAPMLPPTNTLQGQVQIAVEELSPAMLMMRATGQYLDSPNLSTNPQLPQRSN